MTGPIRVLARGGSYGQGFSCDNSEKLGGYEAAAPFKPRCGAANRRVRKSDWPELAAGPPSQIHWKCKTFHVTCRMR